MTAGFTEKLIRSGDTPIHFMVCRDGQGHIAHYFLMCPPQKLNLLKNAASDVVRPQDYGVVVASGFGHEPAEATKRLLKQKYGYDYDQMNQQGTYSG